MTFAIRTYIFFFSSRGRHTRWTGDWSSDVCSSDLAGAGLLAGGVNAVAGGGSLLLFPALVAAGYGTLAANVTNSVALWPGYVGAVAGFRDQLGGERRRLTTLGVLSALGTAVGCVLLLS